MIATHCSDKLAPAFTFCQKRSCAGSCAASSQPKHMFMQIYVPANFSPPLSPTLLAHKRKRKFALASLTKFKTKNWVHTEISLNVEKAQGRYKSRRNTGRDKDAEKQWNKQSQSVQQRGLQSIKLMLLMQYNDNIPAVFGFPRVSPHQRRGLQEDRASALFWQRLAVFVLSSISASCSLLHRVLPALRLWLHSPR